MAAMDRQRASRTRLLSSSPASIVGATAESHEHSSGGQSSHAANGHGRRTSSHDCHCRKSSFPQRWTWAAVMAMEVDGVVVDGSSGVRTSTRAADSLFPQAQTNDVHVNRVFQAATKRSAARCGLHRPSPPSPTPEPHSLRHRNERVVPSRASSRRAPAVPELPHHLLRRLATPSS